MTMVAIRLFAGLTVGAMLGVIAAAFTTASFTGDGAILLDLAWGRVTLVDLYLAFGMMWLWVAFRERSVLRAIAWLLLTVVTGSLAIGVYLLWASIRADDPIDLVLGPARLRELDRRPPTG
jgi:hypothetical protein